jgi:hypothetical protein
LVALERSAIELGVTARVLGVLATNDITVLELDFRTPEAPNHCPPFGTFVHRLTQQRAHHLVIHYT